MKLLSVGRIAPVKNYEVIIRAAVMLGASLTIAGEPVLEQDAAYMQALKNLGGDVKFIGKVSQRNLPDLYRSHDTFVHASKTGSLDKTLLEAMACGLRVVSCNDAARAFLPSARMFAENDPASLVKALQQGKDNFDDRGYVEAHHDVKKIIQTIASKLLSL